MKRKLQSSPSILHAGLIAMIAACCVLIFPTRGFAQNDTVTISAAEFQRIVYSAHLLTQLDARPELDASLQVLLELQRRNPHADPVALARLLEQTTVQYSNTAPAHIRTRAFRDEILATYLEGMRQVPARTNFISANLTLLKKLAVLEDTPYTNQNQQAYLFHTGSRRLLSAGQVAAQQEELVDLCTRRGQANPVFRTAMDSLLAPVIGVWLTNRPAEILLVNPALSNTPSMQLMAYQSSLNADGSVRLSTSVLKNLFAEEMHNMHGIINTNLALHLAILESQTDLTSYLTNRLLMAQNSQRESEIKKGQQQRLSGASASVQALGQVLGKNQPDVANTIKTVGAALHDIGESMDFLKESTGLLKAAAAGGLVAAGLELATLLIDMGPTPEDLVMEEIGQVKSLIRDLSANVNYRFDRVDQSFEQVLEAVAETVNRIDGVAHDVNQARQSLLSIQSDLHSLERSLFDYVSDGFRQELVRHINSGLDYERWWGEPMGYVGGSEYCYQNNETEFYSWSAGPLAFCKASYSSPFAFDLSESRLFAELHGRPLESSLNYINQFCATNLNVALASNTRLANPRDWYLAAQSYLQLALEQPLFFRKAGLHLPDVIATGNEVADFCRNLSFRAGTNVNWELFAALTNHYRTKLNSFGVQLRAAEQKSATARGFSVDSWRWPLSAPKVAAASTEVLESGHPRPTVPAEVVAAATRTRPIFAVAGDANYSHGLVVQTGGTAVAWGADSYRYNVVPDGLSNVVAVAVGFEHNLALRSDGTVVNWGSPGYDKSICPALATNVTFISAGKDHSLAVRADGRVVGWGYNYYGQATGVPPTGDYHGGQGLVSVGKQVLTNAVAAAGGWNYSLALKADGRIVAWGSGSSGETNVPPDLSDVMTIAAGGFHALAARSNGTVVAWGLNHLGQTNVPPGLSNVVAVTAGTSHSLALRSDGTVVAWGSNEYGQTNVPPDLSNVVAIATDDHSSLALREDGTFALWGSNGWLWNGPIPVPAGLTNVVAVDGGDFHILALRADGTVAGWGATQGDYGQSRIPDALSNVIAIAAGDYHSLALRSDGTVAAWGNSNNGQSKVPDGLKNVVAITGGREFSAVLKSDGTVETWGINIGAKPANLTNIVAISAGESYFCLALTANGRVRAWGDSSYGQCGVPAGLTNVVAISAGSTHSLALRADGTVVVWGGNGSSWTVVPSGLSNVVAIAAGSGVSVALKADGTATAWGGKDSGESNVPQEAANIVAIGAGYRFSLYVQANTAGQGNSLLVARSPIPLRVRDHLYAVNAEVLTNLDLDLHASAVDLSGSKALLQAILSLAMPYTLESDDILHGYFYGTEQLMDLAVARQLYSREMASLSTIGYLPGLRSDQVAEARFSCFRDRLWTRLQDLAQTGQPEIPRIVGHTLRLLNLLQDAWPAVPPPAVEMSIEANSYRLLLFGEPYVRYALQEANNLNPPDWTTVTPTNWLSEESLLRNYSTVPKAFYRAVLPVP
jgi:alpha-tubulin suppressor-like RCC1 family protein